MTSSTAPSNGPGARAASVAGIGSAVALVAAVVVLSVPNQASDQELVDWWSKSGNRATAVISMFLMGAAALLFIGLLGRLRTRVAESGPAGLRISQFILGAGITFATCLAITGALRGVIGHAVSQRGEPLPNADLLRYLPQVASTVLGVFAMGAAVAVVVATALATLRYAGFPRWHAVLGAVVALGMVAAIAAGVGELSIPLLAAWLIATSILLGPNQTSVTSGETLTARRSVAPGQPA